ncbi:MAG TPA: class I tRNA ligase family protein, partial [Terriglobales bacterium]|nr:class I tRNA ligase family protein [Terriglobales bacterium]
TCSKCGASGFKQDPDVLDTWFSSGLLPFTALGWPEPTRDLQVFYPTSLLITGFDILFFWVARMIMLGCWFMAPPEKPGRDAMGRAAVAPPAGQGMPVLSEDDLGKSVPFKDVYIHALVRDAERQKMSKTKGNVLDPIHVIEKYGTDATRFTLAAMSSPGTDIAFNESRTEGYRAFANKIWNAARFMFMNMDRVCGPEILGRGVSSELGHQATDASSCRGVAGFNATTLEDRWILSRFNRVSGAVNEALPAYRFDEAANAIYDFFWGEFCDWYIELIKPRLTEGVAGANVACANLVALFEASLRLLHPVMPFITDEIWHAIYDGKPPQKSLALATYPRPDDDQIDKAAETQMAILQDLIVSIRNLRAALQVETKAKVPVEVFTEEREIRILIEQKLGALERLGANVEALRFTDKSLEKLPNVRHTARFDVRLIYEKKIDIAAERDKITKELQKAENERANGERQLSNEQFIAKAPTHVVDKLRARVEELRVLIDKLKSKGDELG